jgi:hypothetical protein
MDNIRTTFIVVRIQEKMMHSSVNIAGQHSEVAGWGIGTRQGGMDKIVYA